MDKEDSGGCRSGKQEGMQSQWQKESPFKEVLEHVKRSADIDCNVQRMRRAYNAKKLGKWESFKEECGKEGTLCEWTLERLHEAYDKVAMEDLVRLSIAQEILRKNTDVAPVDGMGGVTCRTFARIAAASLWMTTCGTRRRLVVCSMRRPIRLENAR